jgi:hypothetical protein
MSEELFDGLKAKMDKFFVDGYKYYKNGNTAAGRRARAASREIRKLLKEWRLKEIEEEKDAQKAA